MQMKCIIVAEPGTVGTAELDAETAKCYSSEDRKRLKKEGETQVAQVSYAHHAAGTELCADPDEHAVSTQTSCGSPFARGRRDATLCSPARARRRSRCARADFGRPRRISADLG